MFPLAKATGLTVTDWQDVIFVNQAGRWFWNEADGSYKFFAAAMAAGLMRRLACTGCRGRRNVVAAPSGQRGSPCAGCDSARRKRGILFCQMAVDFRPGITRHSGLRPRFRNRQTGRAGVLHSECMQGNRIVCHDSKLIYITIVLLLQVEIQLNFNCPTLLMRINVAPRGKPLN
jgi:hypothetical protein